MQIWRFFPKTVQLAFKINLFLGLINTVIAGVLYFFLQPIIPIFYSLAQPNQQLQPKIWIFFYPAFSFVVFVIHALIVFRSKELDLATQKIFSWTTTVIIALLSLLLLRTGLILL